MDPNVGRQLREWADTYNDPQYFQDDPIIFPTRFAGQARAGKCSLKDVEVAAVFASHLAWGRRCMILRDCGRLFDEMGWKPYDYVMRGVWRDDEARIHRTVQWREIAGICARLQAFYAGRESLEPLSADRLRTEILGRKPDPRAPDKKLNMMRRWLVRRDGKVDLGIWRDTDPASLLIPLDVHVHAVAMALGLTERRQKDSRTVRELSDCFAELFPGDPCKGDFALFGYGINHPGPKRFV